MDRFTRTAKPEDVTPLASPAPIEADFAHLTEASVVCDDRQSGTWQLVSA